MSGGSMALPLSITESRIPEVWGLSRCETALSAALRIYSYPLVQLCLHAIISLASPSIWPTT